MAGEKAYVSIWKTSRRGLGERHLRKGYPIAGFPGQAGSRPDGCAYFAKDRWIAEEFAKPSMSGYEDFLVEIQIDADVYQHQYQHFEHELVIAGKRGVELAIPAKELDELNRIGVRSRAVPAAN